MNYPIRFLVGVGLIILGLLGILSVSLTSLSSQTDSSISVLPAPTPTPIPATLTNALWQATLIDGQVAMSEAPVTLVFSTEGNATGTDGCNTFQTEYQVNQPSFISFAESFSGGQKTCSESMEIQATTFKSLLSQVDRYEIIGSNLNLFVGDQVLLIMTARTDPLVGNWQVESMLNSQQQATPIIPETELSMEFTVNGTVFGSSGCNTYTAEYSNLNGTLNIGRPATTEMFCETPIGASEQEQQFLNNLSQITGYLIAQDGSILTGNENQEIIKLIPKPIPGGINSLLD